MAKRRLQRFLEVVWDRDAARRLQTEAEHALEIAGKRSAEALEEELKIGGKKGARALTTHLQAEYKLRMARASQQLAEKTIDEKAFRKEGQKAAEEFNRGLSEGIKKLQGSTGGLTSAQFAGLGSRFKTVPGGGAAGAAGIAGLAGMAGRFLPGVGAVISAQQLAQEARTSVEAANELDASVARLSGTAALAGLNLDELTRAAAENKAELKLGSAVANDLTGYMTQLAARAGDAGKSQEALTAWLDLAASRGLTASEAMQALETTIRGQDEGLNRLGLENPQQIYERWGAGADQASKDMAILSEVMDKARAVQGRWAAQMETDRGKIDQQTQRIRDLQAEAGRAIRPFQMLGLELKVGILETLLNIGEAARNFGPDMAKLHGEQIAREYGLTPRGAGSAPAAGSAPSPAPDPNGSLAAYYSRLGAFYEEDAKRRKKEGEDAEKAEAARVRELNQLEQGRRLRLLNREELMRMVELESQYLGQLERGGLKLEDRIRITNELGQVATLSGINPSVVGGVNRLGTLPDQLSPLAENHGRTPLEEWGDMLGKIESASHRAADEIGRAFQDTFSLMMDEGATVGRFFAGLGIAIAGSLAGALAEYARAEAAKHFAEAIGAAAYALGFTAHGNFASAAAAWSSAAEHTAAGVAFSALSGAGSAFQGATRSRSPGSSYDAGLSRAEDADRELRPIIINIDPFDPASPVHAKQIGEAMNLEIHLSGQGRRIARPR